MTCVGLYASQLFRSLEGKTDVSEQFGALWSNFGTKKGLADRSPNNSVVK